MRLIQKYWLILIILAIGAFLRLYKIDQYMTFLGDEGRDAIVVRNLLVNADPILIGPGTSVGGMYLGPLYYYFMAPFLLLSNFSPLGPALGVALLGIFTIYFVYHVGTLWFSKRAGFLAALLYAISPVVITYSRSSWNPNIMPFFAMLSIYSIWKVWKEQKFKWLAICAISFAFVLQSHYLGLLLFPVLLVYWYLSRAPVRYTLLAVSLFLFLMSPLAIFDIRHDYLNSKAIYKFFTVRQETVSIKPWTAIPKSYSLFEQINSSLITAHNIILGKYVSFFFIILMIFNYLKTKHSFLKSVSILLLWYGLALIGFGLYKQHIYDHYFGFLFPGVILLFAGVTDLSLKLLDKLARFVIYLAIAGILIINFISSPIFSTPNNQMIRSQNVANKIIAESKNENFNIAVIAERNYEDGYLYFMQKENSKVKKIDAQIPETVTNQLFVICEVNGSTLTKEKCDPTHSSKAEVANFGWSKIENEWEVDGVIIYKLVHNYPVNK